MLLNDAIIALCLATKADGKSPQTADAYKRKLKPLQQFLGNIAVEAITVDDLRRYIGDLMDRPVRYTNHPRLQEKAGGLSPHTIASRVRSLKRLFNWLEAEGVIAVNPVKKIKTPRPRNTEPKAVEMQAFLALLGTTNGGTVEDRRDRAIILLLADTGCRVGGLCGLRLTDVNLSTCWIVVTEKGTKTRRVPFNSPTLEAIQSWLKVRPDQGQWLFVSFDGEGKLSPGGVGQMLKRRASKAGIKGHVNPHAFRHFFAREFLLGGGDLATLADLMGHSSVEVTKSSYAIFTTEELRTKHRQYSPVAQAFRRQSGDS